LLNLYLPLVFHFHRKKIRIPSRTAAERPPITPAIVAPELFPLPLFDDCSPLGSPKGEPLESNDGWAEDELGFGFVGVDDFGEGAVVVRTIVWNDVSSGGGSTDTSVGDGLGLGDFDDVTAIGAIGMLGIIVDDLWGAWGVSPFSVSTGVGVGVAGRWGVSVVGGCTGPNECVPTSVCLGGVFVVCWGGVAGALTVDTGEAADDEPPEFPAPTVTSPDMAIRFDDKSSKLS
jgi:hypothetical protein